MNHRDLHSLLDIVHSAKIIMKYVKGVSQDSFTENEQLQDALIRRLLVVGEAAGRVSKAGQEELPTVDWKQIRGLRNRLVHEYDDISLQVVWDITQTEIENPIADLESVIPPEDQLSILE